MKNKLKIRSQEVTEGPERAPARAMMKAMGLNDTDLGKPLIGVSSTWNEATPCNMHLDKHIKHLKEFQLQEGRQENLFQFQ